MFAWILVGIIIGVVAISPILSGEVTFQEVLASSDIIIEKGWKIFEVILE